MKHLSAEEKETASHLKASLWLTVAKIVEQETKQLDSQNDVTATPRFIASLVELVYNQALSLGEDLESFANHAKRKTIQPEDLYMVTRRNEVLTAVLEEFALSLQNKQVNDNSKNKLPSGNGNTHLQSSRADVEALEMDADRFDDDDDELFANM